jgi:hypothetical protein
MSTANSPGGAALEGALMCSDDVAQGKRNQRKRAIESESKSEMRGPKCQQKD